MATPTNGYFSDFKGKQTFAGTDIAVVFSIPYVEYGYLHDKNYKITAELQTLTISSTTSVLPVRTVGESRPRTFNKGARTFAGSMVFTLLGEDPFRDIFSVDALSNSAVNDQAWHIDQMPPFDIIIVAQNETGGIGVQIIDSARIVNWGTTYSVDDMYTESTYTYVAEHVTPFYAGDLVFDTFVGNPFHIETLKRPRTPDELVDYFEGKKYTAREQRLLGSEAESLIRTFHDGQQFLAAGNLYALPTTAHGDSLDPAIPSDLNRILKKYNNKVRVKEPGASLPDYLHRDDQ